MSGVILGFEILVGFLIGCVILTCLVVVGSYLGVLHVLRVALFDVSFRCVAMNLYALGWPQLHS